MTLKHNEQKRNRLKEELEDTLGKILSEVKEPQRKDFLSDLYKGFQYTWKKSIELSQREGLEEPNVLHYQKVLEKISLRDIGLDLSKYYQSSKLLSEIPPEAFIQTPVRYSFPIAPPATGTEERRIPPLKYHPAFPIIRPRGPGNGPLFMQAMETKFATEWGSNKCGSIAKGKITDKKTKYLRLGYTQNPRKVEMAKCGAATTKKRGPVNPTK